MKLTTIWTIPAMTLRERIRRTDEAFWRWLAHRLPRKLAYWSLIDSGVRNIRSDEVVPAVPFVTVLQRAEKS
ncbi:hypothetical protein SEA_SKYSAND_82 [Gordonia phage Skysand]|uniref:Uncharacterized protein n=1 Tax=Gordonia phage Skysand TaxID=2301559 RepID=A0A385DUA3_9CAUD|nr:hypothetical protein KNU08_gp82 [Gordonia phage Skysand]AXQ62115.1 hypothetical protein SEA_SKYSAND_82 [Gordonia phage Skysand]